MSTTNSNPGAARIFEEAKRLGLEGREILLDDRPLEPGARQHALWLQGRAFADLLVEMNLPVQRVVKSGEAAGTLDLGEAGAKPMCSLTVAELRAALRKGKGQRVGFFNALLELEKAQPLLTYVMRDVTRGFARLGRGGRR